MNLALFYVVIQSKPYLWHWKMNFTLSRLPNRNKARKLLKFAVFDIFLSSRIVCCFYARYMYILNQSTNYYTFILQNHKTKISIKLISDMKLLVTIWMESNIAFFTKEHSGFLTWGTPPLLSLAYPVIDCVISDFITDFRQLSCRGEDNCCCWFSQTSIIVLTILRWNPNKSNMRSPSEGFCWRYSWYALYSDRSKQTRKTGHHHFLLRWPIM